MSKQEHDEGKSENTVTYVYLPDYERNGTLIKEGAYMSTVQMYEDGIGYMLDVANEDFIVVDEIGIGYIEETEENL